MKNKKLIVVITILLLAIGFATVSTVLFINGGSIIGVLDDFDIYFSEAILDGKDVSTNVISTDGKTIIYSNETVLYLKNDESRLNYKITNNSKNYDAEVSINCTPTSTDYIKINVTGDTYVAAKGTGSGSILAKLIKNVDEAENFEFVCTLIATAKERTSLGNGKVESKVESATYLTYNATLKDKEGTSLSNSVVVVTNGDKTYYAVTDSNGNFEVAGLPNDNYEIYVYKDKTISEVKEYPVSELETKASEKGTISKEEKNITMEDGATVDNQTVEKNVGSQTTYAYTGVLKDEDGNKLDNTVVIIKDSKGNEFYATTDSNGEFIVNGVETKEVEIIYYKDKTIETVKDYTKNEKETEATGSGKIEQPTAPTTMNNKTEILNKNVEVEKENVEKYTYTGTLKKEDGTPIANTPVAITNGEEVIVATTDSNGNINVSGLDKDNYEIYVFEDKTIEEVKNLPVKKLKSESTISGTLEVDETPTVTGIKVENDNTTKTTKEETKYTYTGTLVNENGNKITNTPVVIIDENNNVYYATTDSNGSYIVENIKSDKVTVIYFEDKTIEEVKELSKPELKTESTGYGVVIGTTKAEITVGSISDIEIKPTTTEEKVEGVSYTYTGNLKDKDGNTLSNKTVLVTDGTNKYYGTTDSEGKISISGLEGKNYDIYVFENESISEVKSYDNSEIINNSDNSGKLSVGSGKIESKDIKTTNENITTQVNTNTNNTYTGVLTDTNGTPVSNATVIVTDGENKYYVTTDEEGYFEVTGVNTGNVEIKYYEDKPLSEVENYTKAEEESKATGTGTGSTESKEIEMSNGATTGNQKKEPIVAYYKYQGVLENNDGESVSNATVVITDGETTKYITTDSNGYFEVSGLEISNYEIYYFEDKSVTEVKNIPKEELKEKSTGYGAISLSSEQSVEITGTDIKVKDVEINIEIKSPNTITYSATLKDEEGNPISNQTVAIIEGNDTKYVTTDENGYFEVSGIEEENIEIIVIENKPISEIKNKTQEEIKNESTIKGNVDTKTGELTSSTGVTSSETNVENNVSEKNVTTETSYTYEGTLKNENNEPLSNATVIIYDDKGNSYITVTDDNGNYKVDGGESKAYEIYVFEEKQPEQVNTYTKQDAKNNSDSIVKVDKTGNTTTTKGDVSVSDNDIDTSLTVVRETYSLSGYLIDSEGNKIQKGVLVFYSDTPHYVKVDKRGYMYVSDLESGSHEAYYINNKTINEVKQMTKDQIKSQATTQTNFTTSSKGFKLNNNYSLKSFKLEKTKNKMFNVTLVTDYDSSIKQTINVKYNQEYGKLPTLTKENSTFLGWYLGNEKIENDYLVSEEGTHILVAKFKTNIIDLTISGYEGVYDENPHKLNVDLKEDSTTIEYSTDGVNYTSINPEFIDAGEYVVYYKATKTNYVPITGSEIVKINKATGNVNLSKTSGELIYPTNNTITVTNNKSNGELIVESSDTNKVLVSITENVITLKPGTTDGNATITVTSKETKNYLSAFTTYNVTVKKGIIEYDSLGYNASYDGGNHGITVTTTLEGANISYSTNNEDYTNNNPTYKDIGEYTVYYKIEKAGYETISGSKKVIITKGTNALTLENTSGETIYPNNKIVNITEKKFDGEITVTSSNEDIATATISNNELTIVPGTTSGIATITLTIAGTTNYDEISTTYTITVKKGTIEYTASNYVGDYDTNAHGINVTLTYPTDAELKFGTVEGTYDLNDSPTFTNIGSYTVYYKIEKAGYETITESKTVTITRPSYTVTISGSNITKGANSITVNYGQSNTVSITPTTGYYLSSVSCTNGYTTNATTGTSATGAQTITISNNNNLKESTCTFNTTILSYTVTIGRNDTGYGTVSSSSVSIPYGTTYSVSGATLTFSNGTKVTATATTATAQYSYAFSSWSSTSGTITGATTINANFTRSTRSYTVTIGRNNTGYGTVSSSSVSIPYGTTYSVSGATLTFSNGTKVTATATTATAQYSYAFSSWSSTSGTITAATTINANFTRTTLFRVGDYVSMTPDSSSYTISTSLTGYSSNQTIKPSELNLWRVIRINSDKTVEMVSVYVSSTAVSFGTSSNNTTGFTDAQVLAYKNYIGTLNTIAKQYAKSGYTVKTRHMGYSNQTETITDTSKIKASSVPWSSSTESSSSTVESQGGGDTGYTTDTNLVSAACGSLIANKAGTTTATNYWLASRRYYYISATSYRYSERLVYASGTIGGNYFIHYRDGSYYVGNSYSNTIRPIVTLGSTIKIASGAGTSSSPYTLTK